MMFYFPKHIFDKYEDFQRLEIPALEERRKLYMDFDLKNLLLEFKKRLRGSVVDLYYLGDSGLESYAKVKLVSSKLVDRVFTTHIVFTYRQEIDEMFKEWESFCNNISNWFGMSGMISSCLGVSRAPNDKKEVRLVFNEEVWGLLGKGCGKFDVVNRSLLFTYLFAKYVFEYGDTYKWLRDYQDCERIIAKCKFKCDYYGRMIEERLERAKEVIDKFSGFTGCDVEEGVYNYLTKYGVLDLDMITLDWLEYGIKDMSVVRDVAYDMWKKGILEPVDDGSFTFNSKGEKMPRKFRLKK